MSGPFTKGIVSGPGSALDILIQDKDEWKKRAMQAESRVEWLKDMLRREAHGCRAKDCSVHGAYDPDDVESVNAIIMGEGS